MFCRLLDRRIEALDGEMELATGLLGVLTRFSSFSSFSAEMVTMQQQGPCAFAAGTACGHLFGSLALTALGFKTVAML